MTAQKPKLAMYWAASCGGSGGNAAAAVAASATGGGGTAGVQDVLLFGLGGAALLAGAGSLAYRRRAMRDR